MTALTQRRELSIVLLVQCKLCETLSLVVLKFENGQLGLSSHFLVKNRGQCADLRAVFIEVALVGIELAQVAIFLV